MTSGKWWSFYGTRGDQDGAVLWDVRCACCGEFVTRHDLAELPSKCPRCGEGAMTNYEKLFGTPERAAETLTRMDVDVYNWCVDDSGNHKNCGACPYEYDHYGCYMPDDISLLEWLESEVRDD